MALKEIICSFLNAEGGMIFIGLKKEKNKQKTVEGFIYSEA
jgi:predicted HTH transcriptional regulator